MRRLSHFLLTLPITLAVVIFAVANRQPVTIDLWPFALEVETPAFVLVVGTLALGAVIGAFLTWLPSLAWRQRAKARERRIAELEKALAAAAPPLPSRQDG